MSEKNVVIRRPNPGIGQGVTSAISARTGWQYEHDETNEQIDAIEQIIAEVREAEGISQGSSQAERGATFTWTSDTDSGEGNIRLATAYVVPGDGEVNIRGVRLTGKVWTHDVWLISPDGSYELQEKVG